MDIYRNTTGIAQFTIPTGTVLGASIANADGTVTQLTTETSGSVLSVTVPLSYTKYDGNLRITVKIDDGTGTPVGGTPIDFFVNVVTPYFNRYSLDDPDFDNLSDSALAKLERLVRNVINAYTGQSFGLRKGSAEVTWSNGSWVTDERIVTMDPFYSNSPVVTYPTSGWSLEDTYYDPKSDTVLLSSLYNPFKGRPKTQTATITGTFGYEYVPFDVQQAAEILAEEFGCNESLWRDRYLKSMKSADWQVQFDNQAFAGTGSVTADQLLAKYVTTGMVVI